MQGQSNKRPDFKVKEGNIKVGRVGGWGGAVCSVVHEMINTGKLLSECFSQHSPYTRMSSEQV